MFCSLATARLEYHSHFSLSTTFSIFFAFIFYPKRNIEFFKEFLFQKRNVAAF